MRFSFSASSAPYSGDLSVLWNMPFAGRSSLRTPRAVFWIEELRGPATQIETFFRRAFDGT